MQSHRVVWLARDLEFPKYLGNDTEQAFLWRFEGILVSYLKKTVSPSSLMRIFHSLNI